MIFGIYLRGKGSWVSKVVVLSSTINSKLIVLTGVSGLKRSMLRMLGKPLSSTLQGGRSSSLSLNCSLRTRESSVGFPPEFPQCVPAAGSSWCHCRGAFPTFSAY